MLTLPLPISIEKTWDAEQARLIASEQNLSQAKVTPLFDQNELKTLSFSKFHARHRGIAQIFILAL